MTMVSMLVISGDVSCMFYSGAPSYIEEGKMIKILLRYFAK